jgi:uncharacterized protein YndB with AHSA1/START domain
MGRKNGKLATSKTDNINNLTTLNMLPSSLEIKAAIQIQKTPEVVFEAIVDPAKMSRYFISKGSDRMEEGRQILWQFPEFESQFPVRTGKIEKDRYISWYWKVDKLELLVEITLEPVATGDTLVTVTEKSRDLDEAGISWLKQNTEGWANFLACLKAHLDHGINLRKGAFDFLKK